MKNQIFIEHAGFDEEQHLTQTIDPPSAEEIDRDLGWETEVEEDEMEDKKLALSTFIQWLTAQRMPEVIFQKMLAAAFCVDKKLTGCRTIGEACEVYHVGNTGEFSKHAKAFEILISREKGAELGAVFRWVFQFREKACAEKRTMVFIAMVRPSLLSVSTMPGMAVMLGVDKQGIHYHVNDFRRTFHSHRFERGGTVRESQSRAARESWARRRAAQPGTAALPPEPVA